MNTLYIIGQGSHVGSVIECIEENQNLNIKNIDYDEILKNTLIEFEPNSFYHIAVGDPGVRCRIEKHIRNFELKPMTICSGKSSINHSVLIDKGSVIMPAAVLRSGSSVGFHTIINTGAIIEHDSRVGDYTNIASGVVVSGSVSIGDFCQIGAGAVLVDKLNICNQVIVGAGAVVLNDILESGTYVGVPARKIN